MLLAYSKVVYFVKTIKQFLKLLGGKQIGLWDASWLDVELRFRVSMVTLKTFLEYQSWSVVHLQRNPAH